MSIIAFRQQDRVMFGVDVPSQVNAYLQEAVAASDDYELAEQLLWRAHREDPDQLEVYVALYKFYFYKNRIEKAEGVVLRALKQAAHLGNFDPDWRKLDSSSAAWQGLDNPPRLYLYGLKALSFIRLRQSDLNAAEDVLNKLQELDPQDQVGGSVVNGLAAALREQS